MKRTAFLIKIRTELMTKNAQKRRKRKKSLHALEKRYNRRCKSVRDEICDCNALIKVVSFGHSLYFMVVILFSE